MAGLEDLAREAVAWMRGRSEASQAEVFLSSGEDRSLSRREGKLDAVETASHQGASVRVARDGRVGFASADGAGLPEIKELYALAVEQLAQAAPTPGGLPAPGPVPAHPALSASLNDATLFTASWEELGARLAAAEAAAAAAGARALRSEYWEERGETVIAGTTGALAFERAGSCGASVTAAAGEGAGLQLGEGSRAARRSDALDWADAGREAGVRAAGLAGAGKAKGGKRSVVFEPWVGVEFLELLQELLAGDEVLAGRSLLAGRVGRRAASELVTLLDEPRRLGGLGSALFDDEGLPTADKAMIEKGVLRGYFHDTSSAARAGETPNACGWRGSYDSRPAPGGSNFFLAPGSESREALLLDTRDGLLVTEVLGMHMVDPVSGAFSVGASGRLIEKGVPGRAFKGAMLSGDLLGLLERVDGVASDLRFYGSIGAPTFRAASIDVA